MRCWIFHAFLAVASAQQPSPSVETLLPAGAEIVETVKLTATVSKPRVMVLWMLNPEHHLDNLADKNREGGYCSDIAAGDFGKYRKGPTRLSLIDSRQGRMINTIEIREGHGEGRDSFLLPVCVSDWYARAGNQMSDAFGTPNMNLRDLTGEGLKAQFVLLVFAAFGIADTGALGYDAVSDRVTHFPIELQSTDGPTKGFWTEQVFAREPVRPGYWKFSWQPGHGAEGSICEDVMFDPVRRLFVQKHDCAESGTRKR